MLRRGVADRHHHYSVESKYEGLLHDDDPGHGSGQKVGWSHAAFRGVSGGRRASDYQTLMNNCGSLWRPGARRKKRKHALKHVANAGGHKAETQNIAEVE